MKSLPQNLRAEFAAFVRASREARRLTIQELALEMGINRSRLGQLERGVHNVTFKTMDALVLHLVDYPGPVTPYSKRVSRRVSEFRGNRFSQEKLSEVAGLSVNFVNTLERGNANSSIDQIEALAIALGVHGSELIAV